jgi:thiol-disulfide isomerase/thioredoxin
MGKKNTTKSIVSALIIIALAVLIVNANKLVSPKVPGEEPTKPIGSESVVDYENCFSEDPSTVVFVYSNSCPYCNNMKPIIEELEKEGYKFYWAESSDSEARDIVSSCFNDLLSGYVPQFICPKTGKEQTGAMSKADLKKFADDCI